MKPKPVVISIPPDYVENGDVGNMSSAERRFYLAWIERYPTFPRPFWNEHTIGEWKGMWDFTWPDLRVALDIHGGEFVRGHHTRGQNIRDDYKKMLIAHTNGWYATAIGGTQADDDEILEMIASIIYVRTMNYLSCGNPDCCPEQ